MTRWIHLLAALSLWGVLAGAAILACGARPTSPGELPRVAPRPDRVDPEIVPLPRLPAGTTSDARRAQPLHPVGAAGAPAGFMFSEQPVGGAQDAGPGASAPDAASPIDAARPVGGANDAAADSYTPPLQPLPDGNLPADSRLEPGRLRD
jgi:hypothetical protein